MQLNSPKKTCKDCFFRYTKIFTLPCVLVSENIRMNLVKVSQFLREVAGLQQHIPTRELSFSSKHKCQVARMG